MSADLFAAFEDAPKPPSKGQSSNPPAQTSFTSDSFSFGIGNATNTNTNTTAQQWTNSSTSQSGQLRNHQQSWSTGGWTSTPLQSIQSKAQDDNEDEDAWGDFEVAPSSNQPPVASATVTAPSRSATMAAQPPTLPRTRVVRASTIDLMTNNLLNLDAPSTLPAAPSKPSWGTSSSKPAKAPTPKAIPSKAPKKTSNTNSNVLFDADDFGGEQNGGDDDDDDFGEFETIASPVQAAPDLLSNNFNSVTTTKTTEARASQLLSGLSLTGDSSYPQAPRSPSFQDRNPFPGLAVAPPLKAKGQPTNASKASPATAWPSIDPQKSPEGIGFGDEWDAFDDLPAGKTKTKTKKTDPSWDWDSVEPLQQKQRQAKLQAPAKTSKPKDSSWEWDPTDMVTEKQDNGPKDDLPPTNIPPPSVLLSLFPQLFNQANTLLYKPVSGQPFSIKNRILSDPKTIDFLKGYLALATVAARIIAGRKLRWHRDKFLSQRMTISAAGSKGMKLAGIDKAQAAREDREATDVVANWKEHIGRLRSAVAAANSSIKSSTEQLKVPEISETMQVQTEKSVPTAPKPCVVCGLKRNERVSKVDYEVEDSFGEWWVDHWGHLACKRFWLQHENDLRQR
ncbi:hypothetical protein M426DRAFT_316644 [Hypoxylon sp. CI-4A]|nr:hypothetical protein M426DRAFT_316644 [Hypoxylon sp. CI-4A]